MNARESGAILSYVNSILQIVVGLLYVPILLSTIGQAEYGLYQLMGSVMSYLLVMNSTISVGVQRFYCKYLAMGDVEKQENVLALSRLIYRILSVIAVLVAAIAAVAMAIAYQESFTAEQMAETLAMLAIVAATVVILFNNSIYNSVIVGHEKFVFNQVVSIAAIVAQPVIVVLLVQLWPIAAVVILVQFATQTFIALSRRIYSKRKLKVRVQMHGFDKKLLRQILVFSASVLLALVADQIFWRTDQFILAFFYGAAGVAVYAVGAQIYLSYMPLGTAVASVFMPKITRLLTDGAGNDAGAGAGFSNMAEVSQLFISVGRIAFYVLALVLTGFAIFGQDFIRLWAGSGYEDAYWVALVVMVPFTVDLMQNLGLTILQVVNKYAFRAKMYFVLSLVNIVITLIVVVPFGIVGAAASTGACMLVGNGLIMNLYYWRVIGLDIGDFWRQILRVALPVFFYFCVFVFCLAPLLGTFGWAQLVGLIVVYTLGYVAVVYAFSFNAGERQLLKQFIRMG